jgi:hypothetical protein
MFLLNVGSLPMHCTSLHPRRQLLFNLKKKDIDGKELILGIFGIQDL